MNTLKEYLIRAGNLTGRTIGDIVYTPKTPIVKPYIPIMDYSFEFKCLQFPLNF